MLKNQSSFEWPTNQNAVLLNLDWFLRTDTVCLVNYFGWLLTGSGTFDIMLRPNIKNIPSYKSNEIYVDCMCEKRNIEDFCKTSSNTNLINLHSKVYLIRHCAEKLLVNDSVLQVTWKTKYRKVKHYLKKKEKKNVLWDQGGHSNVSYSICNDPY